MTIYSTYPSNHGPELRQRLLEGSTTKRTLTRMMMFYRSPLRVALMGMIAFSLTTVIMLFLYIRVPNQAHPSLDPWGRRDKYIELTAEDALNGLSDKKFIYSRNMPIVFIGGMPRSGTTLMRVMLDSHPDIRCGGETRVIPRLLNMRTSWLKAPFEATRLKEAGITSEVLDHAIGEFMLEIIARHGRPAKRLCNKDPFTLKSALYIRSLFPQAQFIYMIRDGRAVVHSIISRKVTISGFDLSNYRSCIKKWNAATSSMYDQCKELGPQICHPVYYEQLVLHPEQTLRDIMRFLKLPWNDSVLHHEQFINQPESKIEMSVLERSTDQVVKPVNTEVLTTWVGTIPEDVLKEMAELAPMLAKLGYDPNANPPNYGDPDAFVLAKEKLIEENREEYKKREEKLIGERESMRKKLTSKVLAKATSGASGGAPSTTAAATN